MKITSFNENWTVSAHGKTESVTLPHDAMVGTPRTPDSRTGPDLGFFQPTRAIYQKKFTPDGTAKKHFLKFDGVMGLCEVYLNRQLLATHPYGYTAFLCDLTPYLREGENEITVRADTTAQVSSRWYTGCGIYRDVSLLTSGADHFVPDGLFVKTLRLYDGTASVEVEVKIHAHADTGARLNLTLAGTTTKKRLHLTAGDNVFSFRMMLRGAGLWTPDDPVLHTCRAELVTEEGGDETEVTFGLRTVETDPERGLLLNGEPVKLYGGCIHHDNGIVGAAAYRAAERRRVRILKENGFNAIRTAHNPPSSALLDACDRMGMLVIDEIFDCWRIGKRDFDYHLFFESNWEADTASMVLRDRNHPSVILWSTGNEIPEKSGLSDGYVTAKKLADLIRSCDPTRPVTHAFCTFWEDPEMNKKDGETRYLGADVLDFWSERTAPIADTLDVSGYNYFFDRLDKDEARFPDRLIAMTESFPLDAVKGAVRLENDPRFIGEFVWTAWDYFGETSIGHVKYDAEGVHWGLFGHPYHIADCGDFDICGFPRPQLCLREAAWNKNAVRLLSSDPAKFGRKYAISAWGFYDAQSTWTYPGQEGQKTELFIFSRADEVEVFVNGVSLGKKTPDENGTARYEAVYEPGEVRAAAYRNGEKVGEDCLATTGKPAFLTLRATREGEGAEIVYLEIELLDENGRLSWTADSEVKVEVTGGAVIGTGTGRNDDDHVYTDPTCRAYHGRLLAAIRPEEPDCAVVVTADGFSTGMPIPLE